MVSVGFESLACVFPLLLGEFKAGFCERFWSGFGHGFGNQFWLVL